MEEAGADPSVPHVPSTDSVHRTPDSPSLGEFYW